MRPGQLETNDFERAILQRLSEKEPRIQAKIPTLHVLFRTYTGVSCYTDFLVRSPDPGIPNQAIGLEGLVSVPGVRAGLGAVLHCKGGEPECLEVYTLGDDHWDGVHDGFSIRGPA
jgi:hypothetical protein